MTALEVNLRPMFLALVLDRHLRSPLLATLPYFTTSPFPVVNTPDTLPAKQIRSLVGAPKPRPATQVCTVGEPPYRLHPILLFLTRNIELGKTVTILLAILLKNPTMLGLVIPKILQRILNPFGIPTRPLSAFN